MIWKAFCLTIIIPLRLKDKLEIAKLTGRFPTGIGKGYSIPLMIYPSKQPKIEEVVS